MIRSTAWLYFLAAISRRAFAPEWSGWGAGGVPKDAPKINRGFREIVLAVIRGIREPLCMNKTQEIAAKAIESAKAALASGVTTHTDIVIKVGTYRNYASSSASPEAQAAKIIEDALSAVFEVYRAGGEYDEVAGDALENFARETGIAYLCGVKE